jgi:predicted RNA-binding Zn ribbon-like protein
MTTATTPDWRAWLTFPPAVDLSNTMIDSPDGPVDLLTTDEELADWIAIERGRIDAVESARSRLAEVRDLRSEVRGLLYAHAESRPLPVAPRRRLNGLSEAAASFPMLRPSGKLEVGYTAADRFEVFAGVIARSAIKICSAGGRSLSVCRAPSCGMFYVPGHPRQRWCSSECGNRARVARHAERRRRAAAH